LIFSFIPIALSMKPCGARVSMSARSETIGKEKNLLVLVHGGSYDSPILRKTSFAFARIFCPGRAEMKRGSASAKGFGPIKWRGDRAVARESEGG